MMSKIHEFTDLLVWQKSRQLFTMVYSNWKLNRQEWFKNQLFRASLSISNNIAEGFERRSRKEFLQFLNIAKGSAGEVKSMLILARESMLIEDVVRVTECIELASEICRMLQGLVNSINAKPTTQTVSEPDLPYLSHNLQNDIAILDSSLF